MRRVEQQHPNGCGVAVFAMLCDFTWPQAVRMLRFNGEPIDFRVLRRKLDARGRFTRAVLLADEADGVWPPGPFAPRHMAAVTQPSGGGHYVAMNAAGVVLDPLTAGERRLEDFPAVSEVLGVM